MSYDTKSHKKRRKNNLFVKIKSVSKTDFLERLSNKFCFKYRREVLDVFSCSPFFHPTDLWGFNMNFQRSFTDLSQVWCQGLDVATMSCTYPAYTLSIASSKSTQSQQPAEDDLSNLPTRPNIFLWSGRNRVDLLSYESKTTDKREQYDWKAEKNLDRRLVFQIIYRFVFKGPEGIVFSTFIV